MMKNRLKVFLIGLLVVLFNVVQVEAKSVITQASSIVIQEDLGKYFAGYTGTFVLYDEGKDQYTIYNPEQSQKRLSPCSSSKIYNGLIGLETGVLTDENTMLVWDETPRGMKIWDQNHTLASAIKNSVVWYFVEFMHQVGREKTQYYYDQMGYGNRDISGGHVFDEAKSEPFWIQSSLKINAMEQVGLLRKLYNDKLPFSTRNMDIIKKCIVLSDQDGIVFSGKTGSGSKDGKYILGWFVGSIEKEGKRYYFAANVEGENASGIAAREISKEILKDMGIMPK